MDLDKPRTTSTSELIRDCAGFRVEAERRRIGVVQEVLLIRGRPRAIVMAGGILRARTLIAPVDEVVTVDPERRLIRLGAR